MFSVCFLKFRNLYIHGIFLAFINPFRIFLMVALCLVLFSASGESETGKFSPAPQEPGEAKILLVDDDLNSLYSGPYLESTHIVTALNDGGYSYDIFRTGVVGDPYDDDGLPSLSLVSVITMLGLISISRRK